MLLLAGYESTETRFWKCGGCCCVPKKGILWVHTEQKCNILSFLASLWIMSYHWVITYGEGMDTVQPLCRSPTWSPGSTTIADISDRRVYDENPSLTVIQLPATWLGFCWWKSYALTLSTCIALKLVPVLWATHLLLWDVHIKGFSPTWLIFLACVPSN